MSADSITIGRPDDWHLHLRDGAALRAVLPHTAERFARAIVMPNLKPPVTTTALAAAYRERIRAARPAGSDFEPLMTLYLTDRTPIDEVDRARDSGFVHGFKLYPAGATTNSDSGVTDVQRIDSVLARMAERGVVLQVHGEVTQDEVDVFEREARFIDTVLAPLVARHPALRVVFEHVTTRAAVDFVRGARPGVAATLTPQHLLHNRNAIFAGGIRPHFYCLPILKTEPDRVALLAAATSGDPRFFLGTDSAAARAQPEGTRLWLRRHVFRARRPRALCRGLRCRRCALAPRRFRAPPRRRLLRPAAQHRQRDPAPPGPARARLFPAGRRRRSWCRCAPAASSPGRSSDERRAGDDGAPLPRLPAGGGRRRDRRLQRPRATHCWRSPRC